MAQASSGRFQLFHRGGSSTAIAFYVQIPPDAQGEASDWHLYGPVSQRSTMLAARFSFQQVEPRLWKTTIVDPCYWSPSTPALYRLQQGEGRGGEIRWCGLRRVESRGGNVWMDGRRWVFRAVVCDHLPHVHLEELGDCRMGIAAGVFTPDTMLRASQRGVPLMLRLSPDAWRSQISEAADYPALQFIVLPATAEVSRAELAARAPNLLYVAEVIENVPPSQLDWHHVLMCPADPQMLDEVRQHQPGKPIIAIDNRRAASTGLSDSPSAWRVACERLQRELAPLYDLSGYVVG